MLKKISFSYIIIFVLQLKCFSRASSGSGRRVLSATLAFFREGEGWNEWVIGRVERGTPRGGFAFRSTRGVWRVNLESKPTNHGIIIQSLPRTDLKFQEKYSVLSGYWKWPKEHRYIFKPLKCPVTTSVTCGFFYYFQNSNCWRK